MVGVVLHMDHETEEPWPLHIYDYDNKHHRIELEAGDMFFFESSRWDCMT